jgi:predicted transcriptional regulator
MKILLSIKPEFAEKIFDGSKKYEYRKTTFKRAGVRTVIVYSTLPVGKIVGEFDIEAILEKEPPCLWDETQHASGIDYHFFDEYFRGKNKGFALKIGATRLFDTPLDPKELDKDFVAPQSFAYVIENSSLYHAQMRDGDA